MKRKGMAGVLAIIFIGLVGVTLSAISHRFMMDAKRTQRVDAETQLRQLLIAGAKEAEAEAVGSATTLDLPPALKMDGATLQITPTASSDQQSSLSIEAILRDHHLWQTITIVNRPGGRAITSAQLNP